MAISLGGKVAGVLLVGAIALGARSVAAQTPSATGETVSVASTYNNAPFEYRIRRLVERPDYRVYRLTYPSPVVSALEANNTIPADYYLPKGVGAGSRKRYPAVICLHILDGNEPLTELVCAMLAKQGVPAVAFKLPYYGDRGAGRGPEFLASDPKTFIGAVEQAGEDIRRTIDLLASRPEIDPARIGISGISLGGIIAATAAGAEPRLHRAALILAGGDLLTIIHHAHETRPLSLMLERLPAAERAEVESKITAADPLRFAANLRARAQAGRVLMLNAGDDEVIPRRCTEKLADALGLADRVVWFEGLGHYTAVAELPRALRMTADFFAQDLPKEAAANDAANPATPTPEARVAAIVEQAATILAGEPSPGCCHLADLEATFAYMVSGHLRLARGAGGKFSLNLTLPKLGEATMGQGRYPWMVVGDKDKRTLLVGTALAQTAPKASAVPAGPDSDPFRFLCPQSRLSLRVAQGAAGSIALAPETLLRWLDFEYKSEGDPLHRVANRRAIRVRLKPQSLQPQARGYFADIVLESAPTEASLGVMENSTAVSLGTLKIHDWRINARAEEAMFEPPEGLARKEVAAEDLQRVFAAAVDFGLEYAEPGRWTTADPNATAIAVVARDPAGHGLLCRTQGKTILLVEGTPAEMGAAQGLLLREAAQRLTERVVYLVGGGDTLHSGTWFMDRMAEIERRARPHIPPRFLEECGALAAAAGVSARDALYANLFPERFHCSGVALMGRATAGGQVLHARVLDYMRDIGLQRHAVVQVFLPKGRHAWMSHGYAGFIGTVTAMNEKGVAIGEMGGRGDGQWDGMPMSFLLRDVMERAETTDEALDILRRAPRTCEYYYVVSDRSGEIRAVECRPGDMKVLRPGEQDPRLPPVPDDTVLISGEDRAKTLARRILEHYGRIDAPRLIEILRRPVAMPSNLHNAIFAPATLEMWVSDAGRSTPACDEPYARLNLRELLDLYRRERGL